MPAMELAKSFEPAEIEKRWYAQWESAGYFKASNSDRVPVRPKPEPIISSAMESSRKSKLSEGCCQY